MKTSKELQKENNFSASFDEQSKPLVVFSQVDREEDLRNDEDDREDVEIEERQDWGNVDPAGGDAPAAPGSAV